MAKKASMDSIKAPDLKNLNKKQSEAINKFDRYSRAEDYSGKVRVDFTKATPMKDIDSKLSKEPQKDEVEEMVEEFSSKRKPKVAASTMNKGVKIRGTYVARKRILYVVCMVILIIAAIALFAPPIFTPNDEESSCRYEDIFALKGVTAFKSEIMTDNFVYNIEALSSDKSESYRICTVAFDVNNYGPFAVFMDDYVISDGGDFKDHIVYSTSVGDGTEIPAFTKKTVKVEILVNKAGLSDEEFDKAITSLTLSTKNMKKRISKNGGIFCIPAWMNVSDVLNFDPTI